MKKLYLSFFSLICLSAIAQDSFNENYKWNTRGYSGYAWTKKASVKNPDPTSFEKVAILDTDDGELSNVPFGGFAVLRNCYDWLSVGFSFESYGLFAYQRSHINSQANASTIEIVGPNYSRSFTLSHQSAMAESFFKFSEKWRVLLGNMQIKPVLGGGVGVGITNLFGFQTCSFNPINDDTQITTIGANHIKKSLAWRVETGLNFQTINSEVSFGISYRYYYGGKFASGTRYQFNDLINVGKVLDLPAWTGSIKANEMKMYISVDFN